MKYNLVIKLVMSTLLMFLMYGLYTFMLAKRSALSTPESTAIDIKENATDTSENCDKADLAYIAFLVSHDLYVISSQACHPQLLLKDVSDSPAWSPDGEWIAVGCQNDSKLCFIETNQAIRNETSSKRRTYEVGKVLSLPKTCSENRIQSISWSPDSVFMAVVCVAGESTSEIYILNLEQNTYRLVLTDKGILRALWSPKDQKILLSTLKGEIYTVDLQGKDQTFLATGWSPEWSSDGQKIVFIKPDANNPDLEKGIAILDVRSLTTEWVYLPSATSGQQDLILGCGDLRFDCRLAWSSDNRYLAVGARSDTMFNWDIFRLDLSTGEIINLTEDLNTTQNYEPDWEP